MTVSVFLNTSTCSREHALASQGERESDFSQVTLKRAPLPQVECKVTRWLRAELQLAQDRMHDQSRVVYIDRVKR